jgi:hypothetical protein
LCDGVHRGGEPGAHACAECQRLRTVSRTDLSRPWGTGGTRSRSGKTWSTITASPRGTRVSAASSGHYAARRPPRRASSSRPRPAKKARSTTATAARWSATGARGSTAVRGSSS